jgi:hypothetical protein
MEKLIDAVAKKFELDAEQVAIVVYGVDLSGRFYLENDGDDTMENILIGFNNYDKLTVEDIENCKYNVYEHSFEINN